MLRSIRLLPLPALAVTVALAMAPGASAATGCQKGKERKLGATYVTKLTTKGVSCAVGRDVAKAWQSKCRRAKISTCTKVSGYRCTEKRPAAEMIPTQYTGYVTCKNASGSKRVTQEYQQNT